MDSADLLVQGKLTVRGSTFGTFVTVAGGDIVCGEVFLGRPEVAQLETGDGELFLAPGTTIATLAVHVQLGGKLLGGGRVVGNVLREGGTVGPGFSPGVLTVDGNYTEVGADGTLLMEVGGMLLGDEYDQLNVTGDVTLAGKLVVRFGINGFAPHAGDEFAFLHIGGMLNGAFSHIEIENLAPGFQFDLIPSNGGLSFHALYDGVSVPEPATLMLMILAAAGWCLRRHRAA